MPASAITSAARRVSVVIPTWNGGERFNAVLAALARQDLEHELVVVDSGSHDDTPYRAAAAGAYVFAIPNAEFQHGATRNRAIERTRGEVVCLLTQDAVPTAPDYLRRLTAAFDEESVDGAYARQTPRPDCDPLLAERLRRWMASRTEREVHALVPGDPAASRARFEALPPMERYLACAFDNVASAVRRSTWERHPFPARPFGEDVAWAREVLLAGGRVAFEPAAAVEHSHRIRMLGEARRIYCDHRNLMELFELRNVPSWAAVWTGWTGQRRLYAELLAGQPLGVLARVGWRLYSIPYAGLETAAQHLGARSLWKARESRFWGWADRRIRRGI